MAMEPNTKAIAVPNGPALGKKVVPGMTKTPQPIVQPKEIAQAAKGDAMRLMVSSPGCAMSTCMRLLLPVERIAVAAALLDHIERLVGSLVDVVDTLVAACHSLGVKIVTEAEVASIEPGFTVTLTDGREWECARLIVATGGLSYPTTGSTGDGLRWAEALGHRIVPTFPSLTALVPRGYKLTEDKDLHIDRSTPLSELGQSLCGVQLKNIQLSLSIEGTETDSEFGDIDFTDGGLEGPVGFQLSRKAVKALVNGSRVCFTLDLKPGVSLTDLTVRVKELWAEIEKDPRSRRVREKERCRILLGKLMPWDLIPGFTATHPEIITLERRGRADTKVWVNLVSIAKALKAWQFEIAGYVGYERAVVTAGGVSTDDFVAKTMESRIVPGLYLCGEVLDIDADTGGYNLQLAFATGALAGLNAAKSLPSVD